MNALCLRVRTPRGLLLDTPVRRVVAEDLSGWFGLRPGREDVVAVLPPGLLVYEDEAGEGFVALSGGLLDLQQGACRVLVGQAVLSRDLGEIADHVVELAVRRRERAEAHRSVVADLGREAMRRLVRSERS